MFRTRIGALSIVILALALVAGPFTALAQDLTQSFTSADGTFSFQYPGDWTAQEVFGTIILANSEAASNAFMQGGELESGQAVVLVLPPSAVAATLGVSGIASPEEMISVVIGDVVEGFSEAELLTIGDKPALRTVGDDQGQTLIVFAVDFGDGGVGAIVQGTVPGEESELEATTRAMIATMEATELVAPAETGTVVWQQLREIDLEATPGEGYSSVDNVVVGPDDTIYVLDSFVGVHVFDVDGNEQGLIVPDSLQGGMEALAIDADGALWTVDYLGPVIQFNSEGETLSSFDASAITELAYFGIDLAVGPDGNLYMLNPRTDENEQEVGEVLVLTPGGELLNSFEIGIDEYFYEAKIKFGPDGNLYVAEYFGENGLKIFDSAGDLVSEGIGVSQVYGMSGLALAADGSIYIAQPDSPIYHFSNEGVLLGLFGDAQYMVQDLDYDAETLPPMDPGAFYSIGDMGVLSNGDVVVADTNQSWWHLTRIHFAE